MTGTVAFSGSPCFTSGNISGTEIANVWDGAMSAGGSIQVYLTGLASASQITGSYYVASGGICTGDYGTFALTRQ
jgi:hypothetical protein